MAKKFIFSFWITFLWVIFYLFKLNIFYSHPSILDIISPKLFTDLLEINETKAFIILDRINAIKTVIEK